MLGRPLAQSIRRNSGEDAWNNPAYYENETHRLPDFGAFGKYLQNWRASYGYKMSDGRPRVFLRKDGLRDNSIIADLLTIFLAF